MDWKNWNKEKIIEYAYRSKGPNLNRPVSHLFGQIPLSVGPLPCLRLCMYFLGDTFHHLQLCRGIFLICVYFIYYKTVFLPRFSRRIFFNLIIIVYKDFIRYLYEILNFISLLTIQFNKKLFDRLSSLLPPVF